MDEEVTKACANCKREIPAVNFTIHSVHCARNIKVCPVCKEPVPSSELDDHHKKMHKLLPCKQCGESVCGTDLEDHVRDSCAHTVKSCRFCELELPRRELPLHEGYCGVRTEQCPDCKEYVMIKYQQLHQDSNHGFIRLDDDPPPPKEPPKVNLNRPQPKFARNYPPNNSLNRPTSLFDDSPRTINRPANFGLSDNPLQPSSSNSSPIKIQSNSSPNKIQPLTGPSSSGIRPSVLRPTKEPANRPGSSTSRPDSSTVRPDSSSARPDSSSARPDSSTVRPDSSSVRPDSTRPSANGPTLNFNADISPNSTNVSITNRTANPVANSGTGFDSCDRPGSSTGATSNTRPFNSDISGSVISNNIRNNTRNEEGGQLRNVALNGTEAAGRTSNGVKKRTNDQPQINMDTSATKTVDKDLGAVSRGAVKKRPAPQPPKSSRRDQSYYSAMARQQREERERREQNEYNLAHGLPPVLNPAQKIEKLRKMDALHSREFEEPRSRQRRPPERQAFAPVHQIGHAQAADEARHEFKNLKPMSPTQFMRRFSSMQVSPPASDRYPEIRSSLRELRRGLNEVTAPYNSQNNNALNNNNDRPPSPADEVQLPCEFCNVLVPAEDLVQHQTGCRPDLAQFVPRAVPFASGSPEAPESPDSPESPAGPVIPCEFCDRHLPLYLIIEHQEQCIRENMPV